MGKDKTNYSLSVLHLEIQPLNHPQLHLTQENLQIGFHCEAFFKINKEGQMRFSVYLFGFPFLKYRYYLEHKSFPATKP